MITKHMLKELICMVKECDGVTFSMPVSRMESMMGIHKYTCEKCGDTHIKRGA